MNVIYLIYINIIGIFIFIAIGGGEKWRNFEEKWGEKSGGPVDLEKDSQFN